MSDAFGTLPHHLYCLLVGAVRVRNVNSSIRVNVIVVVHRV